MNMQEFEAFVGKLGQHDWYYAMSDDPTVYAKGRDNFQALAREAKKSPEAVAVFQAYRTYNRYPRTGMSTQELRDIVAQQRAYIAEQEDEVN